MRRFKQIDIFISIALIVVFTLLSLINQDETFIYGYCVVGYWQVTSMIVHAAGGWFTQKGGSRRTYHWVTFIVICMGAMSPFIEFFLLVFFVLLFTAAPMALYYTRMCYKELMSMKTNPSIN